MDKTALSRRIKKWTKNLGFGLVGIAPAEPPERDVKSLKQWVVEGRHGEMAYMENPMRHSILQWYPEARSIILVGLFYEAQTQKPAPGQGRIASYAVYPEYQKEMARRLNQLLVDIQSAEPRAQGRLFSDTSPVLERSYARLAGLGWAGKNTMLIHKTLGSYFFLGGLALNLELEYDEPDLPHCGTCTRCIDACPTQALTPGHLDATRCIAYLTIEKKTMDSTEELERKTGNWIFGCDICQEVCPFNRNPGRARRASALDGGGCSPRGAAPPVSSALLNPDSHQDSVAEPPANGIKNWEPIIPNMILLETVLKWTEEEFRAYFKGTPVKRAKWKGMRRNAAVAAKNSNISTNTRPEGTVSV